MSEYTVLYPTTPYELLLLTEEESYTIGDLSSLYEP